MLKEFKRTLREKYNSGLRAKLTNNDFTLIASNCNGCCICHDLGVRFNSPFVNLFIKSKDFLKYINNMDYYNNLDMLFVEEPEYSFPIGRLSDIRLYFVHYQNAEEAKRKWYERLQRMNMDNVFFLFSDRDGCTYDDLKEFDALPYRNKAVFCHKEYPDIKSAVYIRGFENKDCIGNCAKYRSKFSIKKYYDDFDFVSWFNGNTNIKELYRH